MVEAKIPLSQFMEDLSSNSHSGCGSCGSGKNGGGSNCGNGLEKIYPTTAIRFGYMKQIGEFTHSADMKFSCGAKVIIQTKRGLEMGEQVSLTCNGCDKSVTREQMKDWVDASGEDSYLFEAGKILREATASDLAEYARIQSDNLKKKKFCQQSATTLQLPLAVVECESLFGGERIIFYFSAAERIDFRSMVKDLAHEYRTRIEMRQIGARDEARLLADFETCGREVCCKVFLKTLRPISMRMAKVQKATLDPSQVSGRCGRLKCCLRYEHVGYEELDKQLPRIGVRIRTSHGIGLIINRQILTQLVQLKLDNNTIVTVVAEDILAVNVPDSETMPEPKEAVDGRQTKNKQQETRKRPTTQKTPPTQQDHHKPSVEKKPTPQDRQPDTQDDSASPPAADTTKPQSDPQEQKPSGRKRRRRSRRRGRGSSGPGSNNPSKPDK